MATGRLRAGSACTTGYGSGLTMGSQSCSPGGLTRFVATVAPSGNVRGVGEAPSKVDLAERPVMLAVNEPPFLQA